MAISRGVCRVMEAISQRKIGKNFMWKSLLLLITAVIKCTVADELSSTPSAATTLGNLYRQARSEAYYASRYGSEGSSVTSSSIGIRGEPEHRDAAYYQSRCITCDPNKSTTAARGLRPRTRYDGYDDAESDTRWYRDRYDEYSERDRGYPYDRMRSQMFDYERPRSPDGYGYRDYDRSRVPTYDYDRCDPYGKNDPARPMNYPDRYDMQGGRDRYNDMRYDRNNERFPDRGNGYDNLDQRHLGYGNRYDSYSSQRRPIDDPYSSRNDRYNRNYSTRYDPYDPYERRPYRRPSDDRYDYYSSRGGPDSRGYFSSAAGPGYERGYANAWNYGGRDDWRDPGRDRDPSDNWRDFNRDRDSGPYRPRDNFYDSTLPPGGSRGTSYLYDRTESSTKPDSAERDKPTSSPQTQENKVYKD